MHNHFTICHWNLNSISAHNFFKIHLLKVNLPIHKFGIVCLSETYLESGFPFDDDNLDIHGYIMVRADHPANSPAIGINITTMEGRKIEAVTSKNGLHQETNEPTHILNNSSSCINLIFNSQPNLLIESGVHPSLHPNCHHQIIFAKFNLDIVYPPPYAREIWHYQKANIDLIKRAINSFGCEKAFSNIDA